MDCDKGIELYLLSEEDAWIMFKMYAGISSSSSKTLIGKGCKIAKECKQLPVAIAVIASCDRVHEWDVILKSLKKPVSMQDVDDDMVEVYKCLKFSYDYLKDEKVKGLFLLCLLFQEDVEIDVETLVRICTGMGIFRDDYCSYNDARNQVVVAKNKLIDSCLLLEVNERNVKMHDWARDGAQWIGNKEFRAVNLSDKIEKSMIEWETSIRHLLCEGDIMDMFSCKLNGSKLETLIVFANGCQDCECMEVPSSFFENLPKLRTFNLSCRDELPLSLAHSIQSLTNIRSILIETVDLGDISASGNLPSLEALDLYDCTINELPSEIAKLEKLKLLFLQDCVIRMKNPFDIIERCPSLEELHFRNSFNGFCQEITLPELQRYLIYKGRCKLNDSLSKSVNFDARRGNECFFSKETFKYCMQTTKFLWLNGMKGGMEKSHA
ncbi:putative P-loop containing nucleoside triphosphate hydrolase, leucine-rich repeat domain, L [Medicago truncatula]|uniref:Putative P-loop containing nucleoside triphosphate hydrolase, leucine-rich repeat domain, L n=1 Tax=Medicago truncatula TaxID=3880 RepID=A0A396IQ71_MEDTR|nr:putative P-loop containing nucleoside triphosphate hydrolase, leucine-rich repeat domain, L [Medicago truncatula]